MTAPAPQIDIDGLTDDERWQAEELVRRYGEEAENVTTQMMLNVLAADQLGNVMSTLRVRRCVRQVMQKEPYTRRLTDKIAAAIEQALEQGRVQLAQRLKPAFSAANQAELKYRHNNERRHPVETVQI